MPVRVRSLLVAALLLPLLAVPARAQGLSVPDIEAALAKSPTGEEAEGLARRIRSAFSPQALRTGAARLQGTQVLWAAESDAPVRVEYPLANIRPNTVGLRRVGEGNLYAAVAPVPNFSRIPYTFLSGDRRLGGGTLTVEYFALGPDHQVQPGVPKGTVTQFQWESKVFAGTSRDVWVYVPAQYRPEQPAAVMVFQDGANYMRADGDSRATVVFDNLIHQGAMPVTVAIFINPGTFSGGRSNRSFEYDTLSDQYARFLRDEILPEVGKKVRLTDDPERRAICGISSGGICAWTVVWEMPDLFRKVISHVGSFTNIASGPTRREGGHNYPALIRKTPRKPIRVWLQDGSQDLDNEHGSWPLANLEMAASLRYMGYDYYFDYGQGFHSMKHGGATLPQALRWLWRDVR